MKGTLAENETDDAIALTLLEMPDFRDRAGLPPRNGGDSLSVIARALGCSRQRVQQIQDRALWRIRLRLASTPELQETLRRLLRRKIL